ncbi:MAG: PQQ-binding-like beta-propeller repeat protein [Candidatus Micrarchaeota archaeon]
MSFFSNRVVLLLSLFLVFALLFGCLGAEKNGAPPKDENESKVLPPPQPPNQTRDPLAPGDDFGGNQPPQFPSNQPPNPPNGGQFPPPENQPQPPSEKVLQPVEGEMKTLTLNNLEISYYSTAASYSDVTNGADLFIHVKNLGSVRETIYTNSTNDLKQKYVPNWCAHFFSFQATNVSLEAGEEKILHYFASNDASGEFNVSFPFWQTPDASDSVSANVRFYSSSMEDGRLNQTAMIYGLVTDKETGKLVKNAFVRANLFTGRNSFTQQTDSSGRYTMSVSSVDDLKPFFIGQEEEYPSLDYFVTVEADGYEYYYKEDVSPRKGEKLMLNLALEPRAEDASYSLDWESKASGYYGFFWVLADSSWKYAVASQAKHPPQLDKPTNFYLLNTETGDELWKYPTENECWGIDIARDGSFVAAGCSDNYVYAVSTSGSLKWKKDCKSMNREVAISHNGEYVLTGPIREGESDYDFALLRSSDGSFVRGFTGIRESLRNSKFTSDDSRFVTGVSFGYTAMFDVQSGEKIWEAYLGEFPLFLAVDENGNTYATGKGRTLFSFDPSGKVRWSLRVPDHTAGTGAVSKDGSRLAIGTVGAWVYYIDGNSGEILWRARIAGDNLENVGHNAVSISEDGKIVSVGGAPENKLFIYNERGTVIFEHVSALNSDPILTEKWASIGAGASAGTQKGIMGTYTSADGSKVLAAYGDNYVRAFSRN